MTEAERAVVRDWLTRCIASVGRLPPSETRNRTLKILGDRLSRIAEPRARPALQVIKGGIAA